MEIRTKFNVGDKVWHLERVFNEETDEMELKVSPSPKRIRRIDFCCWRGLSNLIFTEITYITDYLNNTTCILHLPEQDCFATKEEAIKECDKRNGKAI